MTARIFIIICFLTVYSIGGAVTVYHFKVLEYEHAGCLEQGSE